jgi:hypothetical protein
MGQPLHIVFILLQKNGGTSGQRSGLPPAFKMRLRSAGWLGDMDRLI